MTRRRERRAGGSVWSTLSTGERVYLIVGVLLTYLIAVGPVALNEWVR